MTNDEWVAMKLARCGRHLESGLLTIEEAVTAVLDYLSEVEKPLQLWADAPAVVREQVIDHLARIGPDGLPPVFMIGPTDFAWREAQAVRRREVAFKLLAESN